MDKAHLFTVEDPTELQALWRLVAEAKFQSAPDDADLWGSPYVHALAQRISDALLRSYEGAGKMDAVEAHRRWVESLPNNVVLPVVQAQLKIDAKTSWWSDASREQKLAYILGCVAPFKPSPDFLDDLLREAEA